jgi:hypothetical protein
MIYRGTYKSERITFGSEDEICSNYAVELCKGMERNDFCVIVETDAYDCIWEFETDDASDYERVKFNIMEVMFEVETLDEFIDVLDDIFTDGFADILVDDEGDCDECCGCCECCC